MPRTPTDLELAYLAGMIDADGYITIQRRRREGKVYFGVKVGIAGTRREPHDLAAELFGGSVNAYSAKKRKHRPQFQWSRFGADAAEVITLIRPYLRIKREQARIALEMQEHLMLGRDPYSPFLWMGLDYDPDELSEELAEEMRGLNQWRRKAPEVLDQGVA